MKPEKLFTFGEDEQQNVVETNCISCKKDFLYIGGVEPLSPRICQRCLEHLQKGGLKLVGMKNGRKQTMKMADFIVQEEKKEREQEGKGT